MLAVDFGRIRLAEALRWQADLVAARSADRVADVLMVCEHEPVYTAGRHADLTNVLDTSTLRVVRVDRGGDVTYHGPGQVVIYPILRLTGPRRVRSYVEALEEACIAVAATYGIAACTVPGRPGVWVTEHKLGPRAALRSQQLNERLPAPKKLVAIGVRIQRGATSHGLAFNVDPDLRHYAGIVPCGIADAGVCSLATLGVQSSQTLVVRQLVAALSATLARPVTWSTPQHLAAEIAVDDVA